MSYEVVVLNCRRPENLQQVVDAIWQQEPLPAEVWIWNNSATPCEVAGAKVVNAGRNFGCRARHAFGLLLDSETVVFLDDDVLLTSPLALAPMFSAIEQNPFSVVGPEGRRIGRDFEYWGGASTRFSHVEGPVSVVKGKIHAVRRLLLHAAFTRDLPDRVRREDDIVLCASVQMLTGQLPKAVAGMRGLYTNLPDALGNESRPDHFARRTEAVRHMASLGWDPRGWARPC